MDLYLRGVQIGDCAQVVDRLIEQAARVRRERPWASLELAQKAVKLAKSGEYRQGEVLATAYAANAHRAMGQYKQAAAAWAVVDALGEESLTAGPRVELLSLRATWWSANAEHGLALGCLLRAIELAAIAGEPLMCLRIQVAATAISAGSMDLAYQATMEALSDCLARQPGPPTAMVLQNALCVAREAMEASSGEPRRTWESVVLEVAEATRYAIGRYGAKTERRKFDWQTGRLLGDLGQAGKAADLLAQVAQEFSEDGQYALAAAVGLDIVMLDLRRQSVDEVVEWLGFCHTAFQAAGLNRDTIATLRLLVETNQLQQAQVLISSLVSRSDPRPVREGSSTILQTRT